MSNNWINQTQSEKRAEALEAKRKYEERINQEKTK
jgi:hypothetical protein